MEYPKSSSDKPKKTPKAKAKDVPGSGQARRAGDAIEKRKARNRDALAAATQALNPGKKKSNGYD